MKWLLLTCFDPVGVGEAKRGREACNFVGAAINVPMLLRNTSRLHPTPDEDQNKRPDTVPEYVKVERDTSADDVANVRCMPRDHFALH